MPHPKDEIHGDYTPSQPLHSFAPSEPDELIDPEPLSVFLAVLGFVGSVASIVSLIEFKREQRQRVNEDRNRLVREARDLLMTLEVDTMQIEASLRKLELILVEGSASQRPPSLAQIPLRFGACRPIFTIYGYRQYDEILSELNALVGRSFESTSRLLQRLYNLDPFLNREIADRLIELQNRCNSLLREEVSYEQGFRIYYDVIGFTKSALRDMRLQVDRLL
jgi:hypothetical protein